MRKPEEARPSLRGDHEQPRRARFAELVSEDYVNHNPFVEPGRAGLIRFMAQWFEGVPDTRAEVDDVLVAGDSVVGHFTYRGRHSGMLMGAPPSGAEVTMRSIDIWRVRDGLFVERWDELNTLEVFQQIGVVEMRGAGL
jgi:predicted SnoaL-like aldol condensation-catalyzing enzyme